MPQLRFRSMSSREHSASRHPTATAAYKRGTRKRSSGPASQFTPRALTKDPDSSDELGGRALATYLHHRHHPRLRVLENVAVEHPSAHVHRHHPDVDRLLCVKEHGVAPVRLVDGLTVAAEQLEELAVHVHRVQAVRLVGEAQLAEFAGPEDLRGTVVRGVRGVVIEGFVV